jgi:hypothetical protein
MGLVKHVREEAVADEHRLKESLWLLLSELDRLKTAVTDGRALLDRIPTSADLPAAANQDRPTQVGPARTRDG